MSWDETEADRHAIEFEAQQERIRIAEENLSANLRGLLNASGSDPAHMALFNIKNAGIGRIADVTETLMACIEALSSRVHRLEQNVQAITD